MPAAVPACPRGHDTRTAASRDTQGHCRACLRERRVSDRMKLALVKAFEDVGIRFEDDHGQPVAPAEVVRQIAAIYESGVEL